MDVVELLGNLWACWCWSGRRWWQSFTNECHGSASSFLPKKWQSDDNKILRLIKSSLGARSSISELWLVYGRKYYKIVANSPCGWLPRLLPLGSLKKSRVHEAQPNISHINWSNKMQSFTMFGWLTCCLSFDALSIDDSRLFVHIILDFWKCEKRVGRNDDEKWDEMFNGFSVFSFRVWRSS